MCGSPKLIAACHVLHRLFLPRHPPCALSSLTIELIPRRKRSCCFMPDHSMHISACAPREVRAPLTHEFLKTLNLNTPPTQLASEQACSALYAFTQCNSLSKNRTLQKSSARHEALSNIAPEGVCSKVSLFHRRSSPLSIGQELVELIGIEPMTPCLQSRCSPS